MISKNGKMVTFTALCSAFITIGLISNMTGPLIPYISKILDLKDSDTGLLISANFIGMIMSVIFGGYIADRIGKKKFLISAALLIPFAMVVAFSSESYQLLLYALIFNGIGFGMFEVGINSYAVDFCREHRLSPEKNLNLIHFFFGIGAIISPFIIKYSIDSLGYRVIFVVVAISSVLTALLMLFASEVATGYDEHTETGFGKMLTKLLGDRLLWVTGIMALFYVGIEVTTYGWLPEFWNKSVSGTLVSAPLTASIFWGALTFGRLLSALVSEKLGTKMFTLYAAISLFALTLIWNFTAFEIVHVIIVVFIGIVLSGLFPSIINMSQKNSHANSATVTSFVLIFASLGGSIFPAIAGAVSGIFTTDIIPAVICSISVLFLMSVILYSYLADRIR